MWWADLIWGFWNGLTAWIVLIVHVLGGWPEHALYDMARSGSWYDFGFLVGAGSPFLGAAGAGNRTGRSRGGRQIEPRQTGSTRDD